MFTGCVRDIGIVKKRLARKDHSVNLVIEAKKLRLRAGASIAVSGVCLTVTKSAKLNFCVDIVPETLRRTTLGGLQKGSKVNLEKSLLVGETFDGHFVAGHIDAVVPVVVCSHSGADINFTVRIPKSLHHMVAEKGCLAVDGVSLTVAAVHGNLVTCALIPYTLRHTTLGNMRTGDRVNIEVDILARYIARAI